MNQEDKLQRVIDSQTKEITELKVENTELKEWRRHWEAGAAERRWKALGGSW